MSISLLYKQKTPSEFCGTLRVRILEFHPKADPPLAEIQGLMQGLFI